MKSPVDNVRECIDRATTHDEAMSIAYLARRDDEALDDADRVDRSLPLAGEVLAVKACFDVAGWTTHAGSAVLADAPAAETDALMVAALRSQGAILLAQTNMTEFAYGALGLNSTYGTPATPLLPDEQRVAGGSTSGGAVAVAFGAADIALGSDTSGSIRVPAAFCGVAGFKPSQGRYPSGGMIPLASSFDVPGLIAAKAADLRRFDAALVDDPRWRDTTLAMADVRLLVPVDALHAGETDQVVLDAFEHWIGAIIAAGGHVTYTDMPMLTEASLAARAGSMIAVEAYDWHRDLIADRFDQYDPRVGPRIQHGGSVLAADYVAARRTIHECRRRYDASMENADALVTPTVSILPPRIDDVQAMDSYLVMNTEVLRLTEFANRLDLPSVSLPGGRAPVSPIGLMLTGRRGGDATVLDLAVAIEGCLIGDAG